MAISERINPDNLNIHQFQEVPETSRPELPFDVERDTRPEMKDAFFRNMERSAMSDLPSFLAYRSLYKELWPDDNGPTFLSDEQVQNKRHDLSIKAKQSDIFSKATYVEFLSNAFRSGFYIDMSKDDKKIIQQYVSSMRSESSRLEVKVAAKFIDPEEYKLSDDELQKELVEFNREERHPYIFVSTLAYLRLLNPNYKPNIRNDEWSRTKSELDRLTAANAVLRWGNMVFCMKILTAHKVEITAPGVVEFQMHPPEDVATQTPPMPETRKF